MIRSIFCVYRLASDKDWSRLCVESDSRLLVVIAHHVLQVVGYKRIATGANVNATVVWTFDKGACPYRQE
jgi:hypothetical protein